MRPRGTRSIHAALTPEQAGNTSIKIVIRKARHEHDHCQRPGTCPRRFATPPASNPETPWRFGRRPPAACTSKRPAFARLSRAFGSAGEAPPYQRHIDRRIHGIQPRRIGRISPEAQMTLVDTNVLIDVLTGDATSYRWSLDALDQRAADGALLINDVIYAELAVRMDSSRPFARCLRNSMSRWCGPLRTRFSSPVKFFSGIMRCAECAPGYFRIFSSVPTLNSKDGRSSPAICAATGPTFRMWSLSRRGGRNRPGCNAIHLTRGWPAPSPHRSSRWGEGWGEGRVPAQAARPIVSRSCADCLFGSPHVLPPLTLTLSPRREERRGERGRASLQPP